MELYRPVTTSEYKAIEAKSFAGFPRSEKGKQQMFTALLSESGATEIARRMKTAPGDGDVIYLMRFMVDDAYIRQFPIQNAESEERRAIWIAADEIDILNQHIIGKISVVESFRSDPMHSDTFFA